jgi:hypothetical protein
MKNLISLAALSLIVGDASAHYIFQQLSIGSTKYPVYQYIRKNSNYNSPVTDLTSNDLRCNVGASGASTQTVAVNAGDQFTFTLDTPVYHQGPISMCVYHRPEKIPGTHVLTITDTCRKRPAQHPTTMEAGHGSRSLTSVCVATETHDVETQN